jgi:hypothetical protein
VAVTSSSGANVPTAAPSAAGRLSGWIVALWKGELRPEKPVLAPVPNVPARYLVCGIAVLVAVVALLELVYAQWPIPPGVDSGDWIQRSYGWVGLAHPPMDAVGSPYLYNPLMFPILGLTVLVTGSPVTTGFVFGGFLLALYGISVLHLSRRFLLSGPFQLLFVGLALLNGTTLQILFWGGYPNFLALVFFNEALVFLLAFARSRRTSDALLLYAFAALTFLTHDLTFAILVGSIAVTAVFLLLQDRRWLGLILSKGNIVGMVLLATTVVGYDLVSRLLRISPPGYFNTNPAAYLIDNIGEVFQPLGSAPMLFPSGPGVTVSPLAAEAILAGAALFVMVLLAIVSSRRPSWVDHRHFIAVGVLVAVLVVPVGGYLFHVDTDYTRFIYFLPLPVVLLSALTSERLLRHRIERSSEAAPPAPQGSSATRTTGRAGPTRTSYATIATTLLLVLLAANVTVPMALSNEKVETGIDHDSLFLQSTNWLSQSGQPGAVMTTQGAVRWVEALTDRGAFDVGPTWLLFEQWQIVNSEEAYWAFNAQEALTNNVQVLSYSGTTSTSLMQAPMYSAFIQGVEFPVLRIPPSEVSASVRIGNSSTNVSATRYGGPTITFPSSTPDESVLTYATPYYRLNETGTVGPGGTTWINMTVQPMNGFPISNLTIPLSAPPLGVSLLHAPSSSGDGYSVTPGGQGQLFWNESGTLGQFPGPYPVATVVTTTPAPATRSLTPSGTSNAANMTFANPHPTSSFEVTLTMVTAGASNPAVTLPTVLTGAAFFAAHDVRFLLLPYQVGFTTTESYFAQTYGFAFAFGNSEWRIYQET